MRIATGSKRVATDESFPFPSDPDAIHPAFAKVARSDGSLMPYAQACAHNGVQPEYGVALPPSADIEAFLADARPSRRTSDFAPVYEGSDRLLATPKSMDSARHFFGNGLPKDAPGYDPGTAELSAQTRIVRDGLTSDYPVRTRLTSSLHPHEQQFHKNFQPRFEPGFDSHGIIFHPATADIMLRGTSTMQDTLAHEATHAFDAALARQQLRGETNDVYYPDSMYSTSGESNAVYSEHSHNHAYGTAQGIAPDLLLHRRRYDEPLISSYVPVRCDSLQAKSPHTQIAVDQFNAYRRENTVMTAAEQYDAAVNIRRGEIDLRMLSGPSEKNAFDS